MAFQRQSFVLSDGEKLAVGYSHYDRMYLFDAYHVKELIAYTDYVDFVSWGDPCVSQVVTGERIEFTVSSVGKSSSIPYEEGVKLFRSPKDMSVNDLLALAFQKMEARQEHCSA